MPALSQYQASRLLELISYNRVSVRSSDYVERDVWARANPPLRGLTFFDRKLAIASLKSGNLCAVPIVTASSPLSNERPHQTPSPPHHMRDEKAPASSTSVVTSVHKEDIPMTPHQPTQAQRPMQDDEPFPSPHNSSLTDPNVEPSNADVPSESDHAANADVHTASSTSVPGHPAQPVEAPKKFNSHDSTEAPIVSDVASDLLLQPKRADADRGRMEIPPIPESLPRAESTQSKGSHVSSVPSFGKMPNNLSSDSIPLNEADNSSHLHRGTDISLPSSRLDRESSAEYEEFGNEALITRAYDGLDDDYDMETELTTALFQSIGPSVSVAKAIHRAQHLTTVPPGFVHRPDTADVTSRNGPSYGLSESLHHYGNDGLRHRPRNEGAGNRSSHGDRATTEYDDADGDGEQDPRSESLHMTSSEVDANVIASWTHPSGNSEMAGKSFVFDVDGEQEAAPTPPFHIVPSMTHEPLFAANSYSHVHLPRMEPTPLSPSLFSNSSVAAGDSQVATFVKDANGDGVTASEGSEDREKDAQDRSGVERNRVEDAVHETSPVTVGVPWDTSEALRTRRPNATARLSTVSSSQIKASIYGTNSRSFVSTSDYFSRSEYTAMSDYSNRVDSSVEVETSNDENQDERDVPDTDDERHTEPPSSMRSSEMTDHIADIGSGAALEKRIVPIAGR